MRKKITEFKLDQAYVRYGRELRSLIDQDLYPGGPHTGNMEVDLEGPEPTTWYDVGNWRSGEGMTEFQRFGYVYLTLAYAVSVIQRDVNRMVFMNQFIPLSIWNPFHDFLRHDVK